MHTTNRAPQWMNPADFGVPLTLHLAPPVGHSLDILTIIFDPWKNLLDSHSL